VVSAGQRVYWLLLQLAVVAGGVYGGWRLFEWATG
jgi:hypothetical protein